MLVAYEPVLAVDQNSVRFARRASFRRTIQVRGRAVDLFMGHKF